MIRNLIKHVETDTGLTHAQSRAALGIIFNSADRQGTILARDLFTILPGARTLAAKVGAEIGAATGEIARLIEMTPGGRRHVTSQMLRALHTAGLGHDQIGKIMSSLSGFMKENYGKTGFGTLGDLLGYDLSAPEGKAGSIAA